MSLSAVRTEFHCNLRVVLPCVAISALMAGPPTLSYTRTDLTVGTSPWKVAIADFNHDGKPDVAYLLSGGSAPSVSILLGQGNGVFFGPITTTLGAAAAAKLMAVADLNNDGFPDVITCDFDKIYILLGNGDGTFQTPKTMNGGADGLAIADFNGDGKADFAATSFPGSMVIYLGNGDGTFSAGTAISTGGSWSNAVVAGDFNHDGNLDLAIANQSSSNVSILFGHGNGTFAAAVLYPLDPASGPQALAVGDVTGDGIPDIVAAETSNFSVAVLRGSNSGAFTNIGTFPLNRYVYDLALADMNGDGKLDVVAATNYGTSISSFATVLLGNGNGTFGASMDFAVTPGAISVAVGDLNGDGVPDIAEAGWAGTAISVLSSGVPVSLSPFFTLGKSHTGNFTQGQFGATFSILAGNAYTQATTGTVTVADQLPSGLTLVSMSGSGWTCATGTCSRSDPLGPGSSFPPITVTVNVQPSAGASLTNAATLVNGGFMTMTSDTVNINPGGLAPPVLTSPANGATGVPLSPTLTWTASSGATSYDVYFGTSATPPLVTNVTATNYTPGTLVAGVTYHWQIIAKNAGSVGASSIWSFTTSTAATVMPTSVSPGAGSALTQTFTFTFTDPTGYSDLSVVDVLINNYLDGIGACYFAVAPVSASSGYLYLVDDAGDGSYVSGTPMLLPSTSSLQNSQCTLNGTGSSISASGNTLTLTLAIAFKTAFAGNRIFYMAARSNTQNSGWQALGTWNVPGAAPAGPAVGGVSPARSRTNGQTYTFTFTDTNGYTDLNVLDILTNSFLDGISACYVAYVPTGATTGYLYLVDDGGDGGYVRGSPMLLSPSAGVLQNSQCTISVGASSASASGNTLNLNLAMFFPNAFAGNQVFYLAARNSTTGNSGWQPVGSVTVP